MGVRRGIVRTLWGLEHPHVTWVVTREQTHIHQAVVASHALLYAYPASKNV